MLLVYCGLVRWGPKDSRLRTSLCQSGVAMINKLLIFWFVLFAVNLIGCSHTNIAEDHKHYSMGDTLDYVTSDGRFTKNSQEAVFYRKLIKNNEDNTYLVEYCVIGVPQKLGITATVNRLFPPDSGIYTEPFENSIKRESQFKNGKLNGLVTVWLGNKKSTTTQYKNNIKEGSEIEWSTDGKKVVETIYHSGEPIDHILWASNGSKIVQNENDHAVYYYPHGQKKSEVPLTDGKRNGAQVTYYESGIVLEKASYVDDRREGKLETWYENGQKATEMIYFQGYENGLQKAWYETGELRSEKKMINGMLFHFKEFYKNGQLKYEANYHYGILEGKVIKRDEAGKVVSETLYKKGKKIRS